MIVDIREEGRVSENSDGNFFLKETKFIAGDTGVLEAVARSGTRLSVPVLGTLEEKERCGSKWKSSLMAGTEATAWVEHKAKVD